MNGSPAGWSPRDTRGQLALSVGNERGDPWSRTSRPRAECLDPAQRLSAYALVWCGPNVFFLYKLPFGVSRAHDRFVSMSAFYIPSTEMFGGYFPRSPAWSQNEERGRDRRIAVGQSEIAHNVDRER